MKILISILIALTGSISFAKQVDLDLSTSKINWLGSKKIPGDDHKGSLKFKSGKISLDKKMMLSGGDFTIDMNSIDNTDLKGEWKKKLEGHLKSDDFFAVAKHPTASFKIIKVTPEKNGKMKISGELTLRGKKGKESFIVDVKKAGKTMTASGTMTFDRNKYGVTYNSEASVLKKIAKVAKDKIIKDAISVTLEMKTKPLQKAYKI